jgi:hypothetical protein
MDADLDFRLYAEPDRAIIFEFEEPEVVPGDPTIITNEDGSRCRIISVMKDGERQSVCVPLRDDE